MRRFSIGTIVRLFLFLCCIIFFTAVFKLSNKLSVLDVTSKAIRQTESKVLESTEDTAVPFASKLENIENATTETTQSEIAELETFTEATVVPSVVLNELPLLFPEVQYIEPLTYNIAVDLDNRLNYFIDRLDYECKKETLYTEQALKAMQAEFDRIKDIKALLANDIDRFIRWESEYPYATEVWYFLRENGFSEEVAAGILGNMMTETSGGSLLLNPTIYDPTGHYYGLCQWSIRYHTSVFNKPFEEQLIYLLESITVEFKTFGKRYSKGFTYNDFLLLDTPEEAAHAFAAVYERCATSTYYLRKQAARTAYNYFTNEVE